MAKVSVVIPVYGVEAYIRRCARSLFGQTLNDMEFIFVDDFTPDRSIDLLKKEVEQLPPPQTETSAHHQPATEHGSGESPRGRHQGCHW